jgi:hypothetical protein
MHKPFGEIVDEVSEVHGLPRLAVLTPVVTRDGKRVSAVWFIDTVNHGFRVTATQYGLELHGWNHSGDVRSVILDIPPTGNIALHLRTVAKLIGLLPDGT